MTEEGMLSIDSFVSASSLWWLLYGAFAVIAILMTLFVIYHWRKYEEIKSAQPVFIVVHLIVVSVLLLSSGAALLNYLY